MSALFSPQLHSVMIPKLQNIKLLSFRQLMVKTQTLLNECPSFPAELGVSWAWKGLSLSHVLICTEYITGRVTLVPTARNLQRRATSRGKQSLAFSTELPHGQLPKLAFKTRTEFYSVLPKPPSLDTGHCTGSTG